MKRCLLMFGILLVVVIVASILEHKNSGEVLNEKLAIGQNAAKTIVDARN
ncbi:hypothetical protein [Maribacter flavus]|nr:hypothetical protein [Maribacter flavus]